MKKKKDDERVTDIGRNKDWAVCRTGVCQHIQRRA